VAETVQDASVGDEADARRGTDLRRMIPGLAVFAIGFAVFIAGTIVEFGWFVLVGLLLLFGADVWLRATSKVAARSEVVARVKRFVAPLRKGDH
jgi:hypothetical protein